ncbi:winged helix-turn-helix domain-containing protein [Agaribacterium sp. ZY112]|uniref:winged helix-turn-helix domain-containing protein n=1 Tax=Agaribacterium sp. ZY112 TaxID=3233574 RepID=UPI003524229A
MIYLFDNFRFDSNKLTLYKDDKIVDMRSNEASLLAFLLSAPDTILSKQDILDTVWKNKIVSEQVVFQNISNLRARFGEAAIKTYSRKGYQWQIPSQQASEADISNNDKPFTTLAPRSNAGGGEQNKETSKLNAGISKSTIAISVLVITVLFLSAISLIGIKLYNNTSSQTQITTKISVLPFLYTFTNPEKSKKVQQEWRLSLAKDMPYTVFTDSSVTGKEFNNAPDAYFKDLNKENASSLILTGSLREKKNHYMLNFNLYGRLNKINAYISAPTAEALSQKLETQLNNLRSTGIAESLNERHVLNIAQLQLAYENNTSSLILLSLFIDRLIQTEQRDRALILSEELQKQATSQKNAYYQAIAQLKQGQVLSEKGVYASADKHLQHALSIATTETNHKLQSEIYTAIATSFLFQKQYPEIKNHLIKASASAQQAGEELLEIHAYAYLSVLAIKHGEYQDADTYLEQAELLLNKYRLPQEHYAVIYFLEARKAQNEQQQEKAYQRALSLFTKDQHSWVKDVATMEYTELLISQQRFDDALALYVDEKTGKNNYSGTEHYLLARIYYQQAKYELANSHGKEAFKDITLNGRKTSALNSALLLFKINTALKNSNETYKYKAFIEKEANDFWLKYNKKTLEEAGLAIEQLQSGT